MSDDDDNEELPAMESPSAIQYEPGTQYISMNPISADPVRYAPSPTLMASINPPPDYVMSSILATLCCCWPIGIFAILKSMQCRDAIYRGNLVEAKALSMRANTLLKWTIGVGVCVFILSFVLGFCLQAFVFVVKERQQIDSQTLLQDLYVKFDELVKILQSTSPATLSSDLTQSI